MAWIYRCLVFIFVISSTTCNRNYFGSYFDYPQDDRTLRRIDVEPTPHVPRTNEKDRNQRVNERSIAVNSGIQRVQEQERKRLETREEALPRTENGSYKIVNVPKYPTIANRRGQIDEARPLIRDSVVFPGPTSKSRSFVPEIPAECMKTGICESVPNYPADYIANIIESLGDKRDKFTIDELETPEIAQRIGPAEDSIELCVFREKIVMPQAAQDKDGNWYFIVNQKEAPLQGYRVEICQSDGSPCADRYAHFYGKYRANCKQKFVHRSMTAIDRDSGQVSDMPFKIPSCCSCVITVGTDK